MTVDPKSMSCQEFQEQMSDLIGSGADLQDHPHSAELRSLPGSP